MVTVQGWGKDVLTWESVGMGWGVANIQTQRQERVGGFK